MATKRQPCPRAWNKARGRSIRAAMEIIEECAPLTSKTSPYRNDPGLMGAIARITYNAHHIIGELTSIPAEGEK